MKILALCGSPRGSKSRTLDLVDIMAKSARAAGAEVEIIDVCKLRIHYCTGCGKCYARGKCWHRDDFAAVYAKLLACDGLVLASPNYFRSVSAQLKTFLDRMADAIHCQLLTGKYGCSVGTAGGLEHREVTDYLNGLIEAFGANAVGAVGAAPAIPGAMEAATAEATALGTTLVEAIRSKRSYPEQDTVHRELRARFKQLVTMNKDLWRHEYEYWRNLGEIT